MPFLQGLEVAFTTKCAAASGFLGWMLRFWSPRQPQRLHPRRQLPRRWLQRGGAGKWWRRSTLRNTCPMFPSVIWGNGWTRWRVYTWIWRQQRSLQSKMPSPCWASALAFILVTLLLSPDLNCTNIAMDLCIFFSVCVCMFFSWHQACWGSSCW